MEGRKIHVLALPFPAEGHVTPLMHFTKRLSSRGFQITLVIPSITVKSKAAAQLAHETTTTATFKIQEISDGTESGEIITSAEAYFSRSKAEISKNLDLLIREELTKSGGQLRPDVLVYDSTMPWALDIAHIHGLRAAPFFTESCAVNCIYYNIFQGTLKLSSLNDDMSVMISLPPLPPLEIKDLPCCPGFGCFQHCAVEKFFPEQFLNLDKADWIFINTFDNLENELAEWMARRWPVKTIGPTNVKGSDDDDEGFIINGTEEINGCIEWLDRREMNSVVYVSFGTVAELSEEQMEEIWRGLISSNCYFLWTVRAEEKSKLPTKIISRSAAAEEKGLILEWCPQVEVLEHEAVASFMTHCGWNSTIEALSSGVPMIAMPFIVDQMTNAKFIADVWEAGVRVKADSKGSFSSEDIEMCIKEVTQSKKGKELKRNVLKWKQEIEKALSPDGSSTKNIDDFVAEISTILS